ncbi:MAG TPA: DapH/DapD/GlmU-related protein [Saprospiraceae bacterium]|mgnify:CR=1 FL=1|nr:DapH/DapD/GlmU-related protein [Saprospiraceae bacterium]HMQ83751.1 DapH/DapD/GlmU-related protein [Saprospiraceae bacterium]
MDKLPFETTSLWTEAFQINLEVVRLGDAMPGSAQTWFVVPFKQTAFRISSLLSVLHAEVSAVRQQQALEEARQLVFQLLSELLMARQLYFLEEGAFEALQQRIGNLESRLVNDYLSKGELYHQLPEDFYYHHTARIDQGALIGKGTKIWHYSHVMSDASLGEACSLGQNTFVASGVQLGNRVKIQNNVSLYEGVICEDDVFLGPSMVFTNVKNPRSAVVRKGQYSSTYLERGVSIGANATIICGNRIGAYAFIAAGAVVTKSAPAYALLAGNPARQIGWMSEWGCRLHFDKNNQALCPESGESYYLDNGTVTKTV